MKVGIPEVANNIYIDVTDVGFVVNNLRFIAAKVSNKTARDNLFNLAFKIGKIGENPHPHATHIIVPATPAEYELYTTFINEGEKS